MIRIEHLCKTFGEGTANPHPVLHDINLALELADQGLFLKDITMSAALDSSARIAAITAVSMLCAIWMFTRKA